MRRFLTALTAALVLCCAQPTTASAVPVADLCAPDATRGEVPPGFALDACVDGISMTVRNDLDVPVLVRRDGDVGVPVRVHERGSATATVLRLVTDEGDVLMPGDVARWPLGAAAGTLILADVAPTTTAIVGTLRDALPQLGADDGDQGNFQAFAVVVRGTAAAIEDRTACATGKNFLQVAACDVVAASTVSGTVIGQLPRRLAVQLLPTVLDPDHWADWVGPRRTALTAVRLSERTLAQAAIPAPVVAPPPLPEPSTAPAPGPAAPAVPAAPVALPVPVPVPVPASSPPQLPNPGTGGSRLGGWLEDALGRIGSQEDGNGGGHGGGRGQGNGRGRGGR